MGDGRTCPGKGAAKGDRLLSCSDPEEQGSQNANFISFIFGLGWWVTVRRDFGFIC